MNILTILTFHVLIELIRERDELKKDLLRKHPGEPVDQETARIQRQYEKLQGLYRRIESLSEEKEEICEKLFLMQQNFIRKLDQQIEKTEEDKNVQEKCREDQREQEETFDLAAVGAHGATKKQQKNKPGRAVGGHGYFDSVSGYGAIGSSFGLEKIGKPGGGYDIGSFDSDPLGKYGGASGIGGLGGPTKKNKGALDAGFSGGFGQLNRRNTSNALDLVETSSAAGDARMAG